MSEPAPRSGGIDSLTDVFDAVYRGESPFGKRPPWDIGGPQPACVEAEAAGLVRGAVLDPGCGTGDNALYLAAKGYAVTGLDLAPTAISLAQDKARERGLEVTFEVNNALELAGHDGLFDTVFDSGLAHSFEGDVLRAYAAALHRACRPGATVLVLGISDRGSAAMQARLAEVIEVPAPHQEGGEAPAGPTRSADDLREGFADGWAVESVSDSFIRATLPSATDPFDVHAWLGRFRRT